MRIRQYLKDTPSMNIMFVKNGHLDVEVFTNADWEVNSNNRRSSSWYFALVGENLVA